MYVNLTTRKVFEIAGLPVPDVYTDRLDLPLSDVGTSNSWKENGNEGTRLLVVFRLEACSSDYLADFVQKGNIVISSKQMFNPDGTPIEMIVLPFRSILQLWVSLGEYIHHCFPVPTIAITGSVGKTTTTSMIELLFAEKNKIFSTKGNLNNTEFIVREMARNMDKSCTLHIQEIGGGVPGSVERVAKMLEPDIFVITTILPHHMAGYKTFDNIVADKTSLDTFANEKAFGIINIDNDALREHKFIHPVKTCGIIHKEADYVAENVRQEGAFLKMDIVSSKGVFPVEVNIPGKHNAYNILLAFATAMEAGIEPEMIQRGLKRFHSDYIRQNLTNISGRTFLVDCFNHSVDSINSALSFTQETIIPAGNRKIAVLGGENGLGDLSYKVNYELGLSLDAYDTIDEFIFYGYPNGTSQDKVDFIGNSYAVYKGALRSLRGRKVSYCISRDQLAQKLIRETVPGDFIMLKGIIHLPLWPTVDIAFGAALTMRSGTVIVTNKVSEKNASGVFYAYVNGVNISNVVSENGKLRIPNTIGNKPVFRTGKDCFRNRSEICEVDFGKSIMNIGFQSFRGCTGINELFLPKNILHIEEYAFADCKRLKNAEMIGVEHISSKAFSNCRSLKRVKLSADCAYIADDAFDGCPEMILMVPSGSYAEKWAREHKLPFILE